MPLASVAVTLARWAERLAPEPGDLELADRSLLDTVAVTLAARDHRVTRLAADLPDGARWAVAGHVLDFDDLHMPSTTHISAVCVPTALATGGGPRACLAAAGMTPDGWSAWSRSSSTLAGAGCSTANSRRRSTPAAGRSCGPASSSRRVPGRGPDRGPAAVQAGRLRARA